MEDQKEKIQKEKLQVSTQKEDYPDLFLPVRENYRISDRFHGYSDSWSADNNQMVLVELKTYPINMEHPYMLLTESMVQCMVSLGWVIV